MVDDLRSEPRAEALATIDDSLRTIGEREDAGYVTERMIEHRLRLLAFGAEIGRDGPVRFNAVPSIHAALGGRVVAGVHAELELVVHGEKTEIVRGAEKALRASFVLRMEVENGGVADVTLHAPSLDATPAALPVSRWYVAGTDGRPWDGVLRAGERELVYVIGYVAEPVPPGTDVDAAIHLGSLTVRATARARRRWNDAG
jgi:hypothetical protein